MTTKNLLILGATGATGRLVLAQAKARGYRITAIVRPGSQLSNADEIAVVEGLPSDPAVINKAMAGQDGVLSCLGLRRKNPANPFSKVMSPPDLCTRSAEATVSAMRANGVERAIAISAAGVGDSKPLMGRLEHMGIAISRISVSYRDFNSMEQVFVNSGRDVLMVRPVKLTDDEAKGNAQIVDRCTPKSLISRTAVSTWMLDALERPSPFESFAEVIGEPR